MKLTRIKLSLLFGLFGTCASAMEQHGVKQNTFHTKYGAEGAKNIFGAILQANAHLPFVMERSDGIYAVHPSDIPTLGFYQDLITSCHETAGKLIFYATCKSNLVVITIQSRKGEHSIYALEEVLEADRKEFNDLGLQPSGSEDVINYGDGSEERRFNPAQSIQPKDLKKPFFCLPSKGQFLGSVVLIGAVCTLCWYRKPLFKLFSGWSNWTRPPVRQASSGMFLLR